MHNTISSTSQRSQSARIHRPSTISSSASSTSFLSLKNESKKLFNNRYDLPMYKGNGFRQQEGVRVRIEEEIDLSDPFGVGTGTGTASSGVFVRENTKTTFVVDHDDTNDAQENRDEGPFSAQPSFFADVNGGGDGDRSKTSASFMNTTSAVTVKPPQFPLTKRKIITRKPKDVMEELDVVFEKKSRHAVADEFIIPTSENSSHKLSHFRRRSSVNSSSTYRRPSTLEMAIENTIDRRIEQNAGKKVPIEEMDLQEAMRRSSETAREVYFHKSMRTFFAESSVEEFDRACGVFIPKLPNDELLKPQREERPEILAKTDRSSGGGDVLSENQQNQQQNTSMNNKKQQKQQLVQARMRTTRYTLYELFVFAFVIARLKRPLRRKRLIGQKTRDLKKAQALQLRNFERHQQIKNREKAMIEDAHQQSRLNATLMMSGTWSSNNNNLFSSMNNNNNNSTRTNNLGETMQMIKHAASAPGGLPIQDTPYSPARRKREFGVTDEHIESKLNWYGGDTALLSKREQTRHSGASMMILWDEAQDSFLEAQRHRIAAARANRDNFKKEPVAASLTSFPNSSQTQHFLDHEELTNEEKAQQEHQRARYATKKSHHFFTTLAAGRKDPALELALQEKNNNINSNKRPPTAPRRNTNSSSSERPFSAVSTVLRSASQQKRPSSTLSTSSFTTVFQQQRPGTSRHRPSTVPTSSSISLARATSAQIKRRNEAYLKERALAIPKPPPASENENGEKEFAMNFEDKDDDESTRIVDVVDWGGSSTSNTTTSVSPRAQQQQQETAASLGDFFASLSRQRKRKAQAQAQDEDVNSDDRELSIASTTATAAAARNQDAEIEHIPHQHRQFSSTLRPTTAPDFSSSSSSKHHLQNTNSSDNKPSEIPKHLPKKPSTTQPSSRRSTNTNKHQPERHFATTSSSVQIISPTKSEIDRDNNIDAENPFPVAPLHLQNDDNDSSSTSSSDNNDDHEPDPTSPYLHFEELIIGTDTGKENDRQIDDNESSNKQNSRTNKNTNNTQSTSSKLPLSRQGSGLLRRRSSSLIHRSRDPLLHSTSMPNNFGSVSLSSIRGGGNSPPPRSSQPGVGGASGHIVTSSIFFSEDDITHAIPTMKMFAKETKQDQKKKNNKLKRSPSRSPNRSPVRDETNNNNNNNNNNNDNNKNSPIASSNQQQEKEKEEELHKFISDPLSTRKELKTFLREYRTTKFSIDESSAANVQSACTDRRWGRSKKRDFVLQAIDRCGPDSKFKSSQQALQIILGGSKSYNAYLLRRVALEKELSTRREWLKAMLSVLSDVSSFSVRVPMLILKLVLPAILPPQFCVGIQRNHEKEKEQNQLAASLWRRITEHYVEDTTSDLITFAMKTSGASTAAANKSPALFGLVHDDEEDDRNEPISWNDENPRRQQRQGSGSTSLGMTSSSATSSFDEKRGTSSQETATPHQQELNDNNDEPISTNNDELLEQQQQEQHQRLVEDIRLPVLSSENFEAEIFSKIPETELMFPDVQLMLRCTVRGFNMSYKELRELFAEKKVHFHLPGNVGI